MTPLELIAQERSEQIYKHGRTVLRDVRENPNGELTEGASVLCLHTYGCNTDEDMADHMPSRWDHGHKLRMLAKPYRERLVIAAALIVAELERLDFMDKIQTPIQMDNNPKKEHIYVSGPISDRENGNREEFELAKKALEALGHKVTIPHELTDGTDYHPERDYEKIMRIDVAHMVGNCSMVVTLDDWLDSPGANREVNIARLMLIPVEPIRKFVPSVQH